jgi:hypothetical protein
VTVTARVSPALVVEVEVGALEVGALEVDEELAELDELEDDGVVAAGVGVPPEHPASVRTAAATPTVATEARRRIPLSSLPAGVSAGVGVRRPIVGKARSATMCGCPTG